MPLSCQKWTPQMDGSWFMYKRQSCLLRIQVRNLTGLSTSFQMIPLFEEKTFCACFIDNMKWTNDIFQLSAWPKFRDGRIRNKKPLTIGLQILHLIWFNKLFSFLSTNHAILYLPGQTFDQWCKTLHDICTLHVYLTWRSKRYPAHQWDFLAPPSQLPEVKWKEIL